MARFGISITKSVAFRNSVQEFSNVYYYELATMPNAATAEAIIDNLVTLEKTFHATNVTFVRGRCWSEVGSEAGNEMITQKNLTGTGARTTITGLDKERAFLFRVRAGNDSRGKPVYLRKWYHACAEFVSGQGIPSGVLDQSTGFNTTQRGQQVTAMNAIGNANGSSGSPTLVAKSGRGITPGATWDAHQFLEHHQLGDQWRAQ